MKFTYTERKIDVPDSVKQYSEKKLSKLDRFFQNDSVAQVKYREERGRSMVEVTVRSANMYFRAQETASDMYGAIDAVVNMIERQIRKNKTRLEKRLRSGAFDPKHADTAHTPPVKEEPEDPYTLVRRKRFALKPMSVEEAILQMNLLGHSFFAFKNDEDDGRYCVVYHRNDGGYGLIESD